MNKLIAWFSENKKASNLLMICIMVGGFISLPNMDKEFFPSPTSKTVQINAPYPGAAPVNVEEQICIRIEDAVQDLDGIDEISTTAMQDMCQVYVKAEDDYDVNKLNDDVKARVDAINSFPEDAEQPQVFLMTNKQVVMFISLEGQLTEHELKQFGKSIQKEIETLPHVSSVSLDGVRDYEIAIELNQEALQRYHLSLSEVENAIRSASLDLPSGKITSNQGDILLQVRQQAYQGFEFGEIIVRKSPSGALIKLKDIATISDDFKESLALTWVNGTPAIFLQVEVSEHPDILKTNQTVTDYISAKNAVLPDGVELKILFNLSDMFENRANTLIKNGIGGLALVFLILMLFLRPLLALWVCIGIGVSFLGAFWFMPIMSTSLNMISLFAFLMILGIVVDDAIIVCESIYSEQEKHGLGAKTAIQGAQSVSKPILFAVISTMLVFVPMLLLSGSASEAMKSLPIVVLLCLAFSLIECLLILPSHLAYMPPEGYFKNPLAKVVDVLRKKFSALMNSFTHAIYKPTLSFCLKYSLQSIAGFIAAFAISMSIFIGGWIPFSFLPDVTTDFIEVSIQIPAGEPDRTKKQIAQQLEASIIRLKENTLYEDNETSYIKDRIVWTEDNYIKSLTFINMQANSQLSNADITQRWREYLGNVTIANAIDFNYKLLDSGKPIQLTLAGEDKAELAEASQALKDYLSQFEGTYDISDTLDQSRSEMELSLKSEREFTPWDTQQLANQLRQAFYGTEVQRIPRDGEDIKVMLRLNKDERSQPETLNSLPVTTPNGDLVRMDAIADIDFVPSELDIKRLDRKRTVIVSAALEKDTTNSIDIIKDVMENFPALLAKDFPGVEIALRGEEKERQKFVSEWSILFLQALLAIYVIMAIAFRSYWQPVIILTAIPFGAMGAIIGHLVMEISVSSYSFFGLLACAGVVVNDNLVLIDRINQHREQGMRRLDAVFNAGIDRFRPIVLTSATTFIGLIPIMSETSIQAQFLIPMVVSLAYGVLFATTVTLLLVPCLYLMGENAGDLSSHWQSKIGYLKNRLSRTRQRP